MYRSIQKIKYTKDIRNGTGSVIFSLGPKDVHEPSQCIYIVFQIYFQKPSYRTRNFTQKLKPRKWVCQQESKLIVVNANLTEEQKVERQLSGRSGS